MEGFLRRGWVEIHIVVAITLIVVAMRAQTQPPWISSYNVALGHIRTGKPEVGVRELEALGASFPGDAVLATSIGAALDLGARHEQAERWYQKALAIDPQYEPALNDLALSLASQGQIDRAAPLLRKALRIDPHNGRAAYNLGVIAIRLKGYEEAVGAFQAARKAPDPPAPAETLALGEGTALFKLGRYAEAKALLQISSACSEVASCLLLGSSQALSNDLPAAVSTFQSAVRTAPQNPDAYFRLALTFLQGQRDGEAKDTLAVGLDAIPNSALLLYGQAILYEHLGSYDLAIHSAMNSIEQDPLRADVWSLLGRLRAHEGQVDEADEAFRRALSVDATVDHTVEYAEFLIHSGRYPEAEKMLNEMSKSNKDNPAINRSLGKLYKSEGKFDQAEVFLRHAVSEDPKDPQAHYALAITLERLRRYAEAKKELDLFTQAKEERRFVHVLEIASDPVGGKK